MFEEGAKLADFGFASNVADNSKDNWTSRNRQYLAPEILYNVLHKKSYPIDKRRTDVFAFGMIFFETLF